MKKHEITQIEIGTIDDDFLKRQLTIRVTWQDKNIVTAHKLKPNGELHLFYMHGDRFPEVPSSQKTVKLLRECENIIYHIPTKNPVKDHMKMYNFGQFIDLWKEANK